jgi:hypothetical protein
MRTAQLSFLLAVFIVIALTFHTAHAQESSPSPSGFATPTMPSPSGLAPLEVRIANAKSVKVQTNILGLELGSTLEQAHAKLDKLKDPSQPTKEEKEDSDKEEESENRVLWQLARSEYSAVYVKVDDKGHITYINGFLRPGKEIPFDKMGETKKAPAQSSNVIAWDVIRPNRPLFRVVASGKDRRANSVAIFFVKRPRSN